MSLLEFLSDNKKEHALLPQYSFLFGKYEDSLQLFSVHVRISHEIILSEEKNMKRRITVIAVGLLLTALLISCSATPGGESAVSKEAKIARAISQAVSVAGTQGETVVAGAENSYKVTDFKADDGSVISGTFQLDTEGKIIDAELKLETGGNTYIFVLKEENGQTEATINNEPVNPDSIPRAMTREENFAFRAFIIGFEEALDEVDDKLFDDYIDEDWYENQIPGEYPINNIPGLTGTVTVGFEDDDEDWDDVEIIGADIESFQLDYRRGGSISGSYSFHERGEREESRFDISFKGAEINEDGLKIVFDNITIKATIEEDEIRDRDIYSFSGDINGQYSVNGKTHDISFSGSIEGVEDRYIMGSDYSLTLDGSKVAIGRQTRY